jgi:hypothetical protein
MFCQGTRDQRIDAWDLQHGARSGEQSGGLDRRGRRRQRRGRGCWRPESEAIDVGQRGRRAFYSSGASGDQTQQAQQQRTTLRGQRVRACSAPAGGSRRGAVATGRAARKHSSHCFTIRLSAHPVPIREREGGRSRGGTWRPAEALTLGLGAPHVRARVVSRRELAGLAGWRPPALLDFAGRARARRRLTPERHHWRGRADPAGAPGVGEDAAVGAAMG